jgi:hypothetical protein
MGNKQSRREKVKKAYLKIIENKKKDYYRKNSDVINACDFRVLPKQNWKDLILQELDLLQSKFFSSNWPQHLSSSAKNWNAMKDHKWRSNVLWYDYLHSRKASSPEHRPTITSIRHAPTPCPSPNSFEAQSLIDFLHGHLLCPKDHFIAYMIAKFNFYFIKENTEVNGNSTVNFVKNDRENTSKSATNRLVEEIKAFVMLVLQSMIHYYGGVVSKIIEEKPGEMYDLVLEEVFTDALQDVLLKAYCWGNQKSEDLYREKIEQHVGLRCQDLGIEAKFQIDANGGPGYAKAISKLREIECNYSPLKKLDVIIATTRLICECVDDFWKDEPNMDRNDLIIDADQVLSIFLYIVIKARVTNLKGHLNLIYDFGRKIVQNGQMGYYVTTIEACIMQIETMGPELLSKLKDYSERTAGG